MRGIRRSDRAVVDVIEAAVFLEEQRAGLAERFITAAEREFEKLAEMPGMGAVREYRVAGPKEVRCWRIRGFENWLIFYRVTDDSIEILRVLHGSRDLEFLWEIKEGNP